MLLTHGCDKKVPEPVASTCSPIDDGLRWCGGKFRKAHGHVSGRWWVCLRHTSHVLVGSGQSSVQRIIRNHGAVVRCFCAHPIFFQLSCRAFTHSRSETTRIPGVYAHPEMTGALKSTHIRPHTSLASEVEATTSSSEDLSCQFLLFRCLTRPVVQTIFRWSWTT